MDRSGWERVGELFERLREMPPEELGEALDRECGGDGTLRVEVASLLSAHAAASGFLNRPALKPIRPTSAPERVGEWVLNERLGAGGMGEVFRAERRRDGFVQEAAVKLLARGRVHADTLRSFENERRTLARLDHPYIARFLDGGTTEDAQPWFAMERVDARPIDLFCQEEGLSPQEQIRLCIKVCSALQHAHLHLCVHRDIKPSNILAYVDESGTPVPKLLDFGVAKLLGETESSEATGRGWMTTEFASPEQVAGEGITAASDVYSLGVLTYVLLCGKSPYPARSSERLALQNAVVAGDLLPPPPAVVRALGADIEAVLLRAMSRDPERRYATPQGLAEDLTAVLEHRPVRARPDSLAYRTQRFCRRNRALVALSGVMLMLVAGAAGIVFGQNRVVRAEARRTSRMNEFLTHLVTLPDPEVGRRDYTFLEALAEVADTIDARFEDDPVIALGLHGRLGLSYHRLGESNRAREHLLRALELASNVGDLERARMLTRLGEIEFDLSEFETAEARARSALEVFEARGDRTGESESRNLLGLILLERSQAEAGLVELERALELRRGPASGGPADEIRTLVNVALARFYLDELEEAENMCAVAVRLGRERLDPRHPMVANGLALLAQIHHLQGQTDSALAALEEAVAIRRERLGPHPDLGVALNQLAQVRLTRHEPEPAREALDEALRIGRRLASVGNENNHVLLQTLATSARLLTDVGDLAGAEAMHRELAQRYTDLHGPQHAFVAAARQSVADMLGSQGRFEEAYEEAREVLAMCENGDFATPFHEARALRRIADSEIGLGRFERALVTLHDARERIQATDWEEGWIGLDLKAAQAVALYELGRTDEAWTWAEPAFEGLEALYPNQFLTARAQSIYGAVRAARSPGVEAAELREGYDWLLEKCGPDHAWVKRAEARLARRAD